MLSTPAVGFLVCMSGLLLLLPALVNSFQLTGLVLLGGFLLGFGARVLLDRTTDKENHGA